MTIAPKPQPETTEAPAAPDDTPAVTTTHPDLEKEEEEAARLGDFA